MLTVMQKVNNYFYKFKEVGRFSIVQGSIKVKGKYYKGQFVRVLGSILNDGVYKIYSVIDDRIVLESTQEVVGTEFIKTIEGEEFDGVIASLAVPVEFENLVTRIKEFNKNRKESDLVSESFGSYSYSKATNKDGTQITWEDQFKSDLRIYRKINDDLRRVKVWR